MKKIQLVLALLPMLLFSSCYTSKISYEYMTKIQRGMPLEEVIAILGTPSFRSFDENGEELEFRDVVYGNSRVLKVRLVDNKVVTMRSYVDKYYNTPDDKAKATEEVKEDPKKTTKKDTSIVVEATKDKNPVIKTGSVIVTLDGRHEIVVSDLGGMVLTASGEVIPVF